MSATYDLQSSASIRVPPSLQHAPSTLRSRILWRTVAALERVVAAVALLLLSPALLLTVLTVALLSKKPPIVAHKRVGYRGTYIWVFKVRTMWEQESGFRTLRRFVEYLPAANFVPDCKLAPDPRITSGFAALCRRYSIDELPQLCQILTGTLALVGPRPLTAAELARHYGAFSFRITQVKPGLVGLWQVRGRNRLTYRERRKLDSFMLEHWSPRMYVWILLASIPAVISGRDAS